MKIRQIASLTLCTLLITSAAWAQSKTSQRVKLPASAQGSLPAGAALDRLLASSPSATVQRGLDGSITMIAGLNVATQGADFEARALHFLASHDGLLPVSSASLKPLSVNAMAGRHSVGLMMTHEGVPVWGRRVVVTMDDAGAVLTLTSDLITPSALLRGPVKEDKARLAAARALLGEHADATFTQDAAQVVIVEHGRAELAWMVSLTPTPKTLRPLVFISAVDSRVLHIRDHSAR